MATWQEDTSCLVFLCELVQHWICFYIYLLKAYLKAIFILLIYASRIFMENSPQIDFLDHPKPYVHFRFSFQNSYYDHVFVQNWLLVLAFLFCIKYTVNLTFEAFHNLLHHGFSFLCMECPTQIHTRTGYCSPTRSPLSNEKISGNH